MNEYAVTQLAQDRQNEIRKEAEKHRLFLLTRPHIVIHRVRKLVFDSRYR